MKKKALSWIVVTSLLISTLAGCKSGAAPSSTDQEKESQAAEGKSIVTMLSWYSNDAMKALEEGFEEAYPQYDLDVQYVPPIQQYTEKYSVLIASNELTDLFFNGVDNIDEIIEYNLAEDMSHLPIMEYIPENCKAAVRDSEGHIYNVSVDAWANGITYNKDIFESAGIKELPKTWDELTEIMGILSEKGITPITMYADNIFYLLWNLYASTEIVKDFTRDDLINQGKATFSEHYTNVVTKWYDTLIKPGYLSQDAVGMTQDQSIDMFCNGEAAMIFEVPFSVKSFQEKNPSLNYDMFILPGLEGNGILQGCVGVGISIPPYAKNKDGAWDFIDYFSTPKGLIEFQQATGQQGTQKQVQKAKQ